MPAHTVSCKYSLLNALCGSIADELPFNLKVGQIIEIFSSKNYSVTTASLTNKYCKIMVGTTFTKIQQETSCSNCWDFKLVFFNIEENIRINVKNLSQG